MTANPDKKYRVVLELDETKIKRASNGDEWKFEMLKQATKTATLMEVSCDDHRELRQMIIDNKATLARIAVAVGVILSILTGAQVML